MPLRVLDARGLGWSSDVAAAFERAADSGVRIVNASLGSNTISSAERLAIHSHPETLFVVAAGNGGFDGVGDDVESVREYPCVLPEANVLCVGASDPQDGRARFSNYGRVSVDLLAPGVRIASTFPTGFSSTLQPGYEWLDGTSMSAPYAAGVAALVAAARPGADTAAIKAAIIEGADRPAAVADATVSGGRLNAEGALEAAARAAAPSPSEPQPQVAAAVTAPVAQPQPRRAGGGRQGDDPAGAARRAALAAHHPLREALPPGDAAVPARRARRDHRHGGAARLSERPLRVPARGPPPGEAGRRPARLAAGAAHLRGAGGRGPLARDAAHLGGEPPRRVPRDALSRNRRIGPLRGPHEPPSRRAAAGASVAPRAARSAEPRRAPRPPPVRPAAPAARPARRSVPAVGLRQARAEPLAQLLGVVLPAARGAGARRPRRPSPRHRPGRRGRRASRGSASVA